MSRFLPFTLVLAFALGTATVALGINSIVMSTREKNKLYAAVTPPTVVHINTNGMYELAAIVERNNYSNLFFIYRYFQRWCVGNRRSRSRPLRHLHFLYSKAKAGPFTPSSPIHHHFPHRLARRVPYTVHFVLRPEERTGDGVCRDGPVTRKGDHTSGGYARLDASLP
jgi:hypothetical protein